MSMMTQPAVWRLKTDVLVVTANARIAPAQMNARPTPVFMICPFRSSGPRAHDVVLTAWCSRDGRERDCREPALAAVRGPFVRGIEQATAQVVQRPRQQPGYVH